MNTAEIALEHLVTGVLALAVVLLPVFGIDVVACTLQSGTAAIAMLGMAYVAGIVVDRVCDTVLALPERVARARMALESRFVFRQDEFEARIRAGGDGPRAWMNHLRARLRTARSVAVLGPPAGLALGLAPFRDDCSTQKFVELLQGKVGVASPAAALAPAVLLAISSVLAAVLLKMEVVPRTEKCLAPARWRKAAAWGPIALEYAVTAAAILLPFEVHAIPALVGLVVGAASVWAWWRVNRTGLEYVAVAGGPSLSG